MKKTLSKILLASLVALMTFAVTSCQNKVEFVSYSDEVKAQTFLDTDWGMSIDETVESLGLTIEDIEPYLWEVRMDIDKQYYKINKKMSVNGLSGDVVLAFYDAPMITVPMIDSISTYRNISDKYKDNYVGLVDVYVLLDQTDKEKVNQAFNEELGDTKENELGMRSNNGGYIYQCKEIDIIKQYLDIYKGSIFEREFDYVKDHSLTSVKLQHYPDINSEKYIVTYSGLRMAFLNNSNRKAGDVPPSKMKEVLMEKATQHKPKDYPTILEEIIEEDKK